MQSNKELKKMNETTNPSTMVGIHWIPRNSKIGESVDIIRLVKRPIPGYI